MAAPMPPLPMGDDLEAPDMAADLDTPDMSAEVDPQFAADVAEAFPDLEDAQIAALQRAVFGLMGR
jgi:hypothetical protein